MFGQQQLPADSSAKAPSNDPYLTAVYNAFKKVAERRRAPALHGLGLARRCTRRCRTSTQLLLAGRTTPAGMAKAVQSDWAKFDKTLH